jgi:hypothetical protein
MFEFLRRRARARHLRLLRANITLAEKLASFNEMAVHLGIDQDAAARDASTLRGVEEDLTAVLTKFEASERGALPTRAVKQLLLLWKQLQAQLKAIDTVSKSWRTMA